MPSLSVYDTTVPGWRARNGRPAVVSADPGGAFVNTVGLWVMRWVLVSEVNGPEYDKTWLRLLDYTQPTAYVPNLTLGWDGPEASGGPYRAEVSWGGTGDTGQPVVVNLWWWNPATSSWSLVASDWVPGGAGGFNTSYQFYDGDEVYAEAWYTSHDDAGIVGPSSTVGPYIFTW